MNTMNNTAAATSTNVPNNEIRPGMGATVSCGSDRYGCTVIAATAKRVVVQYDDARQTGDYYGHQRWEHYQDPNGRTATFTLRTLKGGRLCWAEEGRSWRDSARLSVGVRETYQDPSF
jgi:hypothetical protein